ncbi:MAG: hypothetical protein P8I27_08805 [Pirellulaceae bacterium]|nr:hypothetical protein [Pirellulaceae bacterium]
MSLSNILLQFLSRQYSNYTAFVETSRVYASLVDLFFGFVLVHFASLQRQENKAVLGQWSCRANA